mgnify:CR=1 FL=1
MAKRAIKSNEQTAKTPEDKENQLTNLAYRCAEKQLREGTASPSVITHFLKMGTEREKLEREKLRRENDLSVAKKNKLESDQRSDELFDKAIAAFSRYSGTTLPEESDEDAS